MGGSENILRGILQEVLWEVLTNMLRGVIILQDILCKYCSAGCSTLEILTITGKF